MTTKAKRNILFALLMGALMSFAMTFVLTVYENGLGADFLDSWISRSWKAFLVASPLIMVVAPFLQKVVSMLVSDRPSSSEQNYD